MDDKCGDKNGQNRHQHLQVAANLLAMTFSKIDSQSDVGDNFQMLVTVLTVFVINILYHLTLASGTNIQKLSPR